MADDLSMQLRELRKSTDALNALTDRANEVVRRTETYLRDECRVGGPVHVHIASMDEDLEDGPTWTSYLAYERHKGELRIVVAHFLDGDPEESKPWAECSRDVKLKSLEALPQLIRELLKKVRDQVTEVQTTVNLLENMILSPGESQRRSPGPRRG